MKMDHFHIMGKDELLTCPGEPGRLVTYGAEMVKVTDLVAEATTPALDVAESA